MNRDLDCESWLKGSAGYIVMDSELPAVPSGEEILKGSDISLSVSKPLNPPLWEIIIIPLHQIFHVTFSHQNSHSICAALGKILKIGYKRGLKSQSTHLIYN